MGILSDRLFSIEPRPHDHADDETTDDASPQAAQVNTAIATAFLDWRWAIPAPRTAAPFPAHITEQPAFDAFQAFATWRVGDGSFFVEFDGFLIDQQTAAAASGYLSAPPIAA